MHVLLWGILQAGMRTQGLCYPGRILKPSQATGKETLKPTSFSKEALRSATRVDHYHGSALEGAGW